MISALRSKFALPLFGRELVESANRKRTYALRMIVAVIALIIMGAIAQQTNGFLRWMGDAPGKLMIQSLTTLQLWTIIVLMPTMAGVSLPQEKEQGTLVLLFLTPLRPWQLIIQKWLSICLKMVAMLLATLPLYAVAYAYGGVDDQTILGLVLVVLSCIGVTAATGLAVGCWCRKSTGAIILSYLLLLVIYAGWPLFEKYVCAQNLLAEYVNPFMMIDRVENPDHSQFLCVLCPAILIALMLLFCVLTLTRRASGDGGLGLLNSFRGLDRLFEWLERRIFRRHSTRSLPLQRPVLWLEVNRRSLTNARYLVRLFLPFYALLLALMLLKYGEIHLLYGFTLLIVLLLTTIWHAGLLANERSQQTLDVLLASPIPASSIVAQKMAALSRLRWAMSGGLLMIEFIEYYWSTDGTPRYSYPGIAIYSPPAWERLIPLSILIKTAGAIMLPALVAWLSALIGLRILSHRRAIISAIVVMVVWLFVIPMVMTVITQWNNRGENTLITHWLDVFMPLITTLASIEFDNMQTRFPQLTTQLAVMFVVYALLWWFLRRTCLVLADRLMRQSRSGQD